MKEFKHRWLLLRFLLNVSIGNQVLELFYKTKNLSFGLFLPKMGCVMGQTPPFFYSIHWELNHLFLKNFQMIPDNLFFQKMEYYHQSICELGFYSDEYHSRPNEQNLNYNLLIFNLVSQCINIYVNILALASARPGFKSHL